LAEELAIPLLLRSHQQYRSLQSPVVVEVGQSAGKFVRQYIVENKWFFSWFEKIIVR
jgi:hypothetical protein